MIVFLPFVFPDVFRRESHEIAKGTLNRENEKGIKDILTIAQVDSGLNAEIFNEKSNIKSQNIRDPKHPTSSTYNGCI